MRANGVSQLFKSFFMLLCAFVSLQAGDVLAANAAPLPVERAFSFGVKMNAAKQIEAVWQIAPGYYLYAKRMHFSVPKASSIQAKLPAAEIKESKQFGKEEVFSGNLIVPLFLKTEQAKVALSIDYQGCSRDGFCYPPMHKIIDVDLSAHSATLANTSDETTVAPPAWRSLLTDQAGITSLFYNQHLPVMLLIFFGLGILLAFTPCILPMVPILTAIIVGQHASSPVHGKQAKKSRKAFLLSCTYVLGMAVTYAFIGLVAALLGKSLQVWLQKPLFIISGSILFVLLAISIFEFYDTLFIRHWQKRMNLWNRQHTGGTYAGVLFMGIVSTLIVSPCVTAPLVGVLIYIGNSGDMLLGASALFALGVGMGVPLLLIGTGMGKWMPKSGPWMQAIKSLFGILMLAMAIWLLSRVVSHTATLLLVSALLMGCAYFLAGYLPRVIGFALFNRCLGTTVGILAIIIMTGAVFSGHPLYQWLNPQKENLDRFIVVHSMQDLQSALHAAQINNHPVLLDFYADWCESCVIMDQKVFDTLPVKQALKHFVLIRADLSDNTSADEAILKSFHIIAPPTVLFFGSHGQEINSHRIVGEVNANEFLNRLQLFMSASCKKKNDQLQC